MPIGRGARAERRGLAPRRLASRLLDENLDRARDHRLLEEEIQLVRTAVGVRDGLAELRPSLYDRDREVVAEVRLRVRCGQLTRRDRDRIDRLEHDRVGESRGERL